METLKINIPDGYEIDTFDKSSGEIKFKEKPRKVTERIKTLDDLLAVNNLTRDKFDALYHDLSDDEKAYKLLKMLAATLNEGWTPDWNNDNQYKYYPYFLLGGSSGFRFRVYGSWHSASTVGSRLCYKSRELAQHAGNHFLKVYEQFMTIK